jgi:cyanophycinase
VLSQGLGFFPTGVVDQHFDRKARLGRLARTVAEQSGGQRIGFGVDEDTALVVDLATRTAMVAGVGGVTVLDARSARSRLQRGRFAISGVLLSHLAPGDRIALQDLTMTPATGRTRIAPGGGYYAHAAQSGAGMAIPNPGLEDALGVELLDNRASTRLARVSFDAAGAGVRYVFSETPDSWGAYGADRYTIGRVLFSIEPVRVRVQGIAQ